MKVTFLPSLILSTNLIVAANQNNNNNNNNTFIPSPPTIILPPGCTCQKSNVLLSQCTAFNCDCNCDVTPDMCDYNCCCDEDCTNSDKECLYDDSKKNVVRMCYDSSVALENINAKFPMKVEESIENALSGLLCVQTINSASKGHFFQHVGYPPPSLAFAQSNEMGYKRFQYDPNTIHTTAVGSKKSSHASFQMGDLIPVFARPKIDSNNINSFQMIWDGVFRFPSSVDGGGIECNDLNVIEFGVNIEESTCVRQVNHENDENRLETLCLTSLNVDQFVSNLYVGSKANTHIPTFNNNNNEEQNNIIQIMYASYIDANQTELNVSETEHLPITQWDAESSSCQNALDRIAYEVIYNDLYHITNVKAHVQTQHITSSSLSDGNNNGNSGRKIPQTFSLRFVSASHQLSSSQNISSSNSQQPRSGNPGYRLRYPTLGGTFVPPTNLPDFTTHAAYIQMSPKGFAIMDHGVDGQCDSVKVDGTPVLFGEDVMVGCTQKMTRNELEEICATSSPHKFLSEIAIAGSSSEPIRIPSWFKPAYNMLGVFGNADPNDVGQWLHIHSPMTHLDYSMKNLVWLPIEGRCEGLPTLVKYKILWTQVGNVQQPQNKIISAQMELDDSYPMRHMLRPLESQNYHFITTVTWVEWKSGKEAEIPPPPRLFPKLPNDFFYPFSIGKRTTTKPSGSSSRSAVSSTRNHRQRTIHLIWITTILLVCVIL